MCAPSRVLLLHGTVRATGAPEALLLDLGVVSEHAAAARRSAREQRFAQSVECGRGHVVYVFGNFNGLEQLEWE